MPPLAQKQQKPRRSVLIPVLLVLCIVAASALGFFYYRYYTLQRHATLSGDEKIEQVVAKVGRLIDLPQGEVPTLATISDMSKLEGKQFFAHAKIGDQVLVYTAARKAYLYDPEANMIIEVGGINIDTPQQ